MIRALFYFPASGTYNGSIDQPLHVSQAQGAARAKGIVLSSISEQMEAGN